jgi:hypothetical protein
MRPTLPILLLLASAPGCSLLFSSSRVVGEPIDAAVDGAPQPIDAFVPDGAPAPDDAFVPDDAFSPDAFSPDAWVDPSRVSGTVAFQTYGQPAAGARVSVGSVSAVVDAGGRFELAGIDPGPFDLRVEAMSINDRPSVSIYRGVTARRLDVVLRYYSNATPRSVRIEGLVTPLDGTLAAGRELRVLTSTANGGTQNVVADPMTGRFAIDFVYRSDDPSAVAPLWAVEVTPGSPPTLHGFVAMEQPVDGSTGIRDLALAVEPVSAGPEVTIATADMSRDYVGLILQRPREDLGLELLSSSARTDVLFALPTPASVSGAQVVAIARQGLDPSFTVLARNYTGAAPLGAFPTDAPRLPVWTAPTISWAGTGPSLCCVEISNSGTTVPQYTLCGEGSAVPIPADVLAAPGNYTWRVRAFPGMTMDELAQTSRADRYSQSSFRTETVP